MSDVWITIGALVVITAAIKAAAPMIIGGRQLPKRTNALLALLAPALLTALILTETFARGKDLTMDASSVGLVCGGVAIALRAPLLLTVIVAAAGTAAARAIT
jgi:branched-subunit amino acid transport protein